MAASVRDHDHLPLRVAQTAPELLCGIVTEASDPSLCVFLCPKESLTTLSIDKGLDAPPRVAVIDDLPNRQNFANIR